MVAGTVPVQPGSVSSPGTPTNATRSPSGSRRVSTVSPKRSMRSTPNGSSRVVHSPMAASGTRKLVSSCSPTPPRPGAAFSHGNDVMMVPGVPASSPK